MHGNVRWKAPSIVAERVKQKRDCVGDVRWNNASAVGEREKG